MFPLKCSYKEGTSFGIWLDHIDDPQRKDLQTKLQQVNQNTPRPCVRMIGCFFRR